MNEKQKKEQTTGLLVELAQQCGRDSDEWFGDAACAKSIPHHTLALAGEVGELANIVKKVERGSLSIHDPKVRYQLAMELTDAFVYMLNLADLMHVDLEVTYKMVRANNMKRFTEQRAEREARNNGK